MPDVNTNTPANGLFPSVTDGSGGGGDRRATQPRESQGRPVRPDNANLGKPKDGGDDGVGSGTRRPFIPKR